MEITVQAEFTLFGTLKHEGGWYIAHCPPLDITTQGRTEDEARRNLIEASELFVISCFERGTFEQALRELGWHVVPAGAMAKLGDKHPISPPKGSFGFPIPIPFGFEKAAGCHA
jgi:predicted RNase H-like HicB family nuclease